MNENSGAAAGVRNGRWRYGVGRAIVLRPVGGAVLLRILAVALPPVGKLRAFRSGAAVKRKTDRYMADECYGTGFALSGGFVKGYAHLGALQALFEYGIRPDIIAGVSIGAVAGVFIADGKTPKQVLELFMSKEFRSFTGFTRSRGGFMNLDNFYGFLRETLSVKRIEELALPLVVTATDLDTGLSVHFREGEIAPRVAASCCVPGLFTPIEIDGDRYVDGGVLMNLPVSLLRGKCEKVVAVNLSRIVPDRDYRHNVFGILLRTYHLMSHCNVIHDRRNADMLIEPDGLAVYGNTQLDKGREIFDIGYEAARKVIEQVKDIVYPLSAM